MQSAKQEQIFSCTYSICSKFMKVRTLVLIVVLFVPETIFSSQSTIPFPCGHQESAAKIAKAYLCFQYWKSLNLKIFFISLYQRRVMSNFVNWTSIYKLSRITLTMISENTFEALVIIVQQKHTNQ
jgi:hypothetical protein